jgi:prophage regulatory protein
MTANSPDRILRLRTVLNRTGLCRSTLYRKIGNGTFPSQVQLSVRCVGWRETDIEQWQRNPMFYRVEDYSTSA